MKIIPSSLLLIFMGTLTGFSQLVFEHTFKDRAGVPLSQILIRATPINGNPGEVVEKRTEPSGAISIDLADNEWFVEIDQAELLERGYFCVPGSCFSAICQPIIIDAVPLTPILGITRSLTGSVSVVAEFDWITGIDPVIYRRFRIERSTDMFTWEPISTVLLSNPPLRIIDPKANSLKATYYRAIEEESFQAREITWIEFNLDDLR